MLQNSIRSWLGVFMLLTVLSLLLPSCSIDEGDRCVSGYTYDPKLTTCILDSESSATADASEEDAAGTDAGTTDDSGSTSTGFGVVCTAESEPSECDAYDDVEFCVLAPAAANGVCSIPCALDDLDSCPTEWTCCDCGPDLLSVSDPVCVDTNNSQLLGMAEQVCDCASEH